MINKDRRLGWRDYLVPLFVAPIILVQGTFGFQIAKICGMSMVSSFADGEYVFTYKVHDCSNLRRGDVITFYPDQSSSITYIKRVVGLPGETIEARDNTVYVNGRAVSFWHGTGNWEPITVPANAVFVLGDNRAHSLDSRMLGCIPFSQICAKVIGKDVLLS